MVSYRLLLTAAALSATLACFPATAQEARSDPAPVVQAYLDAKMPEEIGRVSVTADQVVIRGKLEHPEGIALAEVPMEKLLSDPTRFVALLRLSWVKEGEYQVNVPRKIDRDGHSHDRLLSKWQLVRKSADGAIEPVSHARFADDIACRSPDLPEAKPRNKKGLGGWAAGRGPADELDVLGISAITVNVMVQSVISLEPGPDRTEFQWEGRTYYANENALKSYDKTFVEAEKRRAMVSAILLVPNPAKDPSAVVKIMGHPDATPEGIFSMPNLISPDGIALYGAALNLMAERWSKPDGVHGRVHHWIIHNEIGAGWVWTNCGVKEAASFMDLYYRSMRITHLIARQYDPHAKAFISLDQQWAVPSEPHFYPSRQMIDLLAAYSKVEGNFAWAIAYHPYPQNLFNPRTWEDNEAALSFDAKKITPRNLEVLDAYVRRPELAGPDGKPRTVHLSENGFNSPDYSDVSLRDQAAGMAYAWKKIEHLSTIQAWQYHNWIDNRGEGGLKIGLRKFPDEPGHELEAKPIWYLYKALATLEEDKACAPYLSVTGLPSWSAVGDKFPVQ